MKDRSGKTGSSASVDSVAEEENSIVEKPEEAKTAKFIPPDTEVEPEIAVQFESEREIVDNCEGEPEIDVKFESESCVSTKNAEGVPAVSTSSNPNGVDGKSFSFVSEDEGTTAAFLGATLDRMAEAIDGLTWDLDCATPVKSSAPVCGEDDDISATQFNDDSQDEEETDSEGDSVDDEGAKILDGDEEDDVDDDVSHDSWQVVAEEEQIGRAAQALGSALFNSEIERSSDNVSTLSNSQGNVSAATGLSTLATVPSTVRSIAPEMRVLPIQVSRWAAQLDKLHELGFTNDALSVSILETLSAANIGCDSDEEVSVQQVVNAMMKD